jgi:hypothetical protein
MPRGKRKPSGFNFTVRLESGVRLEWYSTDTHPSTDAEIAAAIRRYLVPLAERLEAAPVSQEEE